MHLDEDSFKEVKKDGSSRYFLSTDEQYFKKRVEIDSKILLEEYANMERLHENLAVEGLEVVRSVEVSEQELITRYVDAETLLEALLPDAYEKFGELLREFHREGYTHSHLQFNDVLYDGNVFYLVDLGYLNKKEPIIDVVSLKVGLDVFKVKRPWKWREYERCFRRFIEGYGLNEFSHEEFVERYGNYFDKRIDSYRSDGPISWKFHALRILKRLEVIGAQNGSSSIGISRERP